ncbi:MAG: putative ABC transporter permease [Atopobiaceae bacterium]|nr:putative ABC transporter permease [Atopobiaceae bacterium]
MSLSSYVVWFIGASLAGWLFESLHAIVKTGHWERRGFLYGPFCPIYGVGLVAAVLLFDKPAVASGAVPPWAVFLLSMGGSAVLEYAVSVAFEKLFGAVWWDYSDMPLNLNGRICLPASLLFGLAGVFVAYVVIPFLHGIYSSASPFVFELGALVATALLASDLTGTVLSLTDLMERIRELDVSANDRADERLQQGVAAVKAIPAQIQSKGKSGVQLLVTGGKTSARKAMGTLHSQRDKLGEQAFRLTRHQARLLRRLRRFQSADLQEKAGLLRAAVAARPMGDDAEAERRDER